ncbi:MAG TPA: type VII secretion-associated serine protease mycosin [Pilimelia sp.]|nr:type VII secretion-associated serine protease mycosin [Pilimelia sp.]
MTVIPTAQRPHRAYRPTSCGAMRAAAALLAALVAVVAAAPPAHADRTRDAQWHLKYLNVSQAHRLTQGQGVTVAVIDTGVDATHPGLATAVISGRDYANTPLDPPDGRRDTDGHGTAMAGLIAARGDGNDGALGIAPQATILPVRRSEGGDLGRAGNTTAAIRWAVQQDVDVISMSFVEKDYFALAAAVEEARRANIVLVAGVGNRPEATTVSYPAAYPGVIGVGLADRRGNASAMSVTGSGVDILAPAVDVMSTRLNGAYALTSGTSAATALVAGAAALVRAAHPDLSAAEVAHRLTSTATDKGAKGRDDQYGYGVLNLVAALTAEVPPLPAASADPTGDPTFTRPGPPPAALPDGSGTSGVAGAPIMGAGFLLLVLAAVGAFLWTRRRRAA